MSELPTPSEGTGSTFSDEQRAAAISCIAAALRQAYDQRELNLVTNGVTPDEAINATERDARRRLEALETQLGQPEQQTPDTSESNS